jgi:hypothetical protein
MERLTAQEFEKAYDDLQGDQHYPHEWPEADGDGIVKLLAGNVEKYWDTAVDAGQPPMQAYLLGILVGCRVAVKALQEKNEPEHT